MTITIRPVQPGDRQHWDVLWQGYQDFYRMTVPSEVSDLTWDRFFESAEPVAAFVAEYEGSIGGFAHTILHRNTGMGGYDCYLQDLFTRSDLRRQGIGRRLIEAVVDHARRAGAPRVYWLTHQTNTTAQSVYDAVAERTGFIHYQRTIDPAA